MNEEVVVRLRLDPGNVPAASQATAQAIGKIGEAGTISARQTAAAMRTLPAQFTDVATQLAGGQNPLLILLQQGGQIKDSFGGIGPAIRAVGAAVSPAALGVGALAAASGLLVSSFVMGTRESQALRSAILLTGNAAGTTVGQLQAMAARVDAVAGSQSEAAAVLAQLVSTGNVSRAQLEQGTQAAIQLQRNLGVAVDTTVKALSELGRDPLQASMRLNEQYKFLTSSVYQQIRALAEQGRTAEAAAVAQGAFAEVGIKRAQEMERSLGGLQRGWRTLSDVAKEAWDSMLGIGRVRTVEDELADVQSRLAAPLRRGGSTLQADARREALRDREAQLQEMLRLQRRAGDREAQASAELAARIKRDRDAKMAGAGNGRPGPYDFVGPLSFDEQFPAANVSAITAGRDANRAGRVGELAGYDGINKAASEALASREAADRQLVAKQDDFLQDMRDANRRAGLLLIQDERERAEALVRLDQEVADRRLSAKGLDVGGVAEARRLNAERAELEIAALGRQTGASTYDDVRGALQAAFRDSSNPAKAFANALGNAIFTRVSAGLADALATAAVGKSGNGGLLGDLLGFVGNIGGGGVGVSTNNTGGSLPTRGGLATGTNYVPRDMFALLHKGEAVVPAKYNQGGGGGSNGRMEVHYHVPAGQSPAAYAAALADNNRRLKAEIAGDLARPGRSMNNAMTAGA